MTAFPHRAAGRTPVAKDLHRCLIFSRYGFFALLVEDWLLDIFGVFGFLGICRCNEMNTTAIPTKKSDEALMAVPHVHADDFADDIERTQGGNISSSSSRRPGSADHNNLEVKSSGE